VGAVFLKTGERRKLVEGATEGRFVPPGYLVYNQGNGLMAAPFDPVRLEVTGAAVPVVEGVRPYQYNFSEAGSLVYVPGSDSVEATLIMLDRRGVGHALAAPVRAYDKLQLSPDGSRLALAIGEDMTDVWVYDLSRETLTRLTFEGALHPIWTPDGKRVTYVSRRNGTRRVFWKAADGSGSEEEITKGEFDPVSWSPDGKFLVIDQLSHSSRSYDIQIFSLQDKKMRPFLQTPFNEVGGHFSPDGRFLAYASEESGQVEVYVQAFPGGAGKFQISTEGGEIPRWGSNGRELFFLSNNNLMSVGITTYPTFSAGKPRKLFEADFRAYAVKPDGQEFIIIRERQKEAAATQINLVVNWFEELKRRVPLSKK